MGFQDSQLAACLSELRLLLSNAGRDQADWGCRVSLEPSSGQEWPCRHYWSSECSTTDVQQHAAKLSLLHAAAHDTATTAHLYCIRRNDLSR